MLNASPVFMKTLVSRINNFRLLNMDKIKKGSIWRKWDLHFHTPSSYDYGDKSVTNIEIINELVKNDISVVAITDHHVMDIERITELQKLAKDKNITVFPGIEFLSDSRGSSSVHFIGIFPETSNIKYIWGQIANRTNISKIQGDGKKANEVYCNIETTLKLIKELGGLSTIHAGGKSNTIENITHSLPHKEAQKTDIAKQIDFYELGKPQDKDGYLKFVFPEIKKHIPMIICSDNHNINKYILKENCWIKADPTFEGLKQVVYEPKERVRIQKLKPHDKAGYQAIESISIDHGLFYAKEIHFNENLNSIIGGRSTGKSILLGSIAKKLNCDKEVKYNNKEYSEFVDEVVANMVVKWKDNTVNDDRDIEYFPQGYMYRLARNENNELNQLIESIIRQDPKKSQTLSSLDTFNSDLNTEIKGKINKLFQLQENTQQHKQLLKDKGDEKGIRVEIEKLTAELAELKLTTLITKDDSVKYNQLKEEKDIKKKINESLNKEQALIENLKSKIFTNTNIDFELVMLREVTRHSLSSSFSSLKKKFETEWEQLIDNEISNNQKEVKTLTTRIIEIEKDPIYIKGLRVFRDNEQHNSVEMKLKIQKDKLEDINRIQKEISDFNEQIESIKKSIKGLNKSYLTKIDSIKSTLEVENSGLNILAKPILKLNRYKEQLNFSINQQSYQGQNIVNQTIFNNDDFFNSLHSLFNKLVEKKVTLKGGANHIDLCQSIMSTNFFEITYDIVYQDTFSQMSEGKKAFVVLMLLLDFSTKDCPILIDQPEDDLDNRAIYNDLVSYLKKKKRQRQVILVTHNPNIAVGSDSEQIIVANQHGINTPNLNNVKFQYSHGSLENTKPNNPSSSITLLSQGIREHVCEILEGGNEAFKKREKKYAIE